MTSTSARKAISPAEFCETYENRPDDLLCRSEAWSPRRPENWPAHYRPDPRRGAMGYIAPRDPHSPRRLNPQKKKPRRAFYAQARLQVNQ